MAEETTTTEEETTTEEGKSEKDAFLDEVNEVLKGQDAGAERILAGEPLEPDDTKKIDEPAKEEPKAEDDKTTGQEDVGEKAPEIDDALLERAVQAGLSLKDAKAIGNPDVLDSIVGRLEAAGKDEAAKATESEEKAAAETAKTERDEALAKMDLNPDDYNDDFVEAMRTAKALIQGQDEKIAKMHDEYAALQKQIAYGVGSEGSWVDGSIDKLGPDWQSTFAEGKVGDAARAKLQRHIEFAQSDAKAEGKKLTNAAAFKQAVSSGFGDKVTTLKGSKAKELAAKRSATALNRPRKTDGTWGTDGEHPEKMTDDERDAATEAKIAGYWK